MGPLWLVALLGLGGYAIWGAKTIKWKLINAGIILGTMATGFTVGYLAGIWGKNGALGAEIAIPLTVILGAVAGLGCIRRNMWRDKTTWPTL